MGCNCGPADDGCELCRPSEVKVIDRQMFEVLLDWLRTSDNPDTGPLRAYADQAIKEMQALIFALVDEGAAEIHEEGCPQDDTCCCPLAARVNAALHKFEG
jgi:hypothetical protein